VVISWNGVAKVRENPSSYTNGTTFPAVLLDNQRTYYYRFGQAAAWPSTPKI